MAARRVVVVGGGVAGASITRELAKAGCEVTLLERSSQLCSGATWHAAGLVTRFGGSSKLKKLHVRSMELLEDMHETHDVGLHLTGSIRLVAKGDDARALEARRHLELAKLYDVEEHPTRLLAPDECGALHPLLDASTLELGLYTPHDGDICPNLLTYALAKEAKAAGARIVFEAEVASLTRVAPRAFDVATKDGARYEADAVVNCCGLWAQTLSAELGLEQTHPAFVTEPIAALRELRAAGSSAPVLRDLKSSCYLRQEQDGILVGPYEHLPAGAVHDEWGRGGPPKSWAWDLFPDDVDRLEDVLISAIDTVPALGDVGFSSVVNGPTIWAPDALPRCGRTEVPGYFDFNTLTYGIAHSMPLAEYLKAVMLDGEQPYDLSNECDPLRYGPWATDGYAKAKVVETYSANNAVGWPFENRDAGRGDVARSGAAEALAAAQARRGALMTSSDKTGVKLALAFVGEASERKERRFADFSWAPHAAAEATHVRQSAGISCAVGFSKLRVTSADDSAIEHDAEWLRGRARALLGEDQTAVTVADASDALEILLLAGPRSKDVLLAAVDDAKAVEDLGFLKFSTAPIRVASVPCTVARVSFTGEAGYELHCAADDAAALYDALLDADASKRLGLAPFGSHATNSLRLEKGFKVKGDLDYALGGEAGIDAFCRTSAKGAYVGRGAAAFAFDAPGSPLRTRSAALFAVETAPGYEWSVPGDAPVVDGAGNVVGVTTTSAYGTEARATLASGFLFDEAARGAPLFVECYGETFPAAVLAAPPAPVRGRDAPPVAFAAPSVQKTPEYALGGVRAQSSRAGNHLRPLDDESAPALEIVAKSGKPWETDEYFALTRLPVEAAHTFGRDMYVSEAIFASEAKLLFDREWVCSGVAPDVAKHGMVAPLWAPGAPVSARLRGEPQGPRPRAYYNVCRHRGAKLVREPASKKNVVTCPYHKWGYALDGRLVGTPCWDDGATSCGSDDKQVPKALRDKFTTDHVEGFDKSQYGLFPVAGLRHYPVDELVVGRRATVRDIPCNWKILAENFMEYYHLPAVHPLLCTVSGVDEHLRTQGRGKCVAFATAPLTDGGTCVDPSVAPPMPGLEDTPDATAARHVLVYPNVFMSWYPNHVMLCVIEPVSAGVSHEHFHVLVHPKIYDDLGDRADETIDDFFAWHVRVNNEDMDICQAVQEGVSVPSYEGGRFSFRFEETIHRCQNMVADSLAGNNAVVPPADPDFVAADDLARPAA
ncbi:oxidoreductase [Aureococcus anophagefferens]|nr:oxidoreductase [Aureococcus anophagefferens]